MSVRRLILTSFQSPGDVVMLTAAVRELHRAHPNQFLTDVRTSADALWENNPHLTTLQEGAAGAEVIRMHYPLIHNSNQRPYHFIHGYAQYLEQRLGVQIPITEFQGDIHLSSDERAAPPEIRGVDLPERFWIIVAGGKFDFTAKWWNPNSFQKVVDRLQGRVQFVQCGEDGHWHPRLDGVVDLLTRTSLRDFVRLMHFADGVVCPVTLAMHLAAAVETQTDGPPQRPCVVIAGGREPPHWETYPGHRFLSTVGALTCCAHGGCWKSRCQKVGDGDAKDRRELCEQPVRVSPELEIPRCMEMITPDDVVRNVEMYLDGGVLSQRFAPKKSKPMHVAKPPMQTVRSLPKPERRSRNGHAAQALIRFDHGPAEAIEMTVVLKHLRHYHAKQDFDLACPRDVVPFFQGICRDVFCLDEERPAERLYDAVHRLSWSGCTLAYPGWPSTPSIRCLMEEFRLTPIDSLCRPSVGWDQRATEQARAQLSQLCKQDVEPNQRFPVAVIHAPGGNDTGVADLSAEFLSVVCERLASKEFVPLVVSAQCDQMSVPGSSVRDAADTNANETTLPVDPMLLTAIIANASVTIGTDGLPLRLANATATPAIGVWTNRHPVHTVLPATNVLHLVPPNHEQLVCGKAAATYFERRYRHAVYESVLSDIANAIDSVLPGAAELQPAVAPSRVPLTNAHKEKLSQPENEPLRTKIPGVVKQAAENSWRKLLQAVHPCDLPVPQSWQQHYTLKYEVAALLQLRRICNIGFRAGYSAFMFLQACPDAFLLGIDKDRDDSGGRTGLVDHARDCLADVDLALLLYDVQRLQELPGRFDLVHVEGNCSYSETRHALELAWQAAPLIWVDDYALTAVPDVKTACDEFFRTRDVQLELLEGGICTQLLTKKRL